MEIERFKERHVRDCDGDWFSTGLTQSDNGKWVRYDDIKPHLDVSLLLDEMAEVMGKIEKYYDFPSEVLEEIAPEWLIDVIQVMKKYRERQSLANPKPQPPKP